MSSPAGITLLDARPASGEGLQLVAASPRGLELVSVDARFRAYLEPRGLPPERLAMLVGEQAHGVEAWVEEWWAPPWYDHVRRIVVLESRSLGRLEALARAATARGAARRANTYPGPLVEALWRSRLTPGCPLRVTRGSARTECPGPLGPDPPLRIARLRAVCWHGPCSVPWEEPLHYVVECCGWRETAGSPEGALGLLVGARPHLVDARLPDRWRLPLEGGPPWLWFDPERSLVGPRGLLEWMRVSGLPYSEAHGAPIGKILTAAEARLALERRWLVAPSGGGRRERFRPLRGLVESDMAGAARIPKPGLYWGVAQLDFSSLYPSLISRFNISAETVDRPVCPGLVRLPGDAPHAVCREPRGLVSEVLGRLVERRARMKRAAAERPWLGERAEALKWILVSGFGYLGYRNSLFGSIMAYETVTFLARWALRTAEEVAERLGYRLVHSIVDSIFVQPASPRTGLEDLAREISGRVGVPLRVEARYTWLYIPATRRGPGAVNKYYGALREGGLKLRGVAAVRRDTPPLIARAQRAAIAILAGARSPEQFVEAAERARRVLERVARHILEESPDPRLLVIEKRLGDSPRSTPWRRAAGEHRWVARVRYIQTRRGPRPVWDGPPGPDELDRHYYLERLRSASLELPIDARPVIPV